MKPEFEIVIQPTGPRESLIKRVGAIIREWPIGIAGKIEIAKLTRPRTIRQNKALFGHAYQLLLIDTGTSVNDSHEYFCSEFFGTVDHKIYDRVITRPYRTTTRDEQGHYNVIDTDTFVRFFDMVVAMSAFNGIDIPDPRPDWREEQERKIRKEKLERERQSERGNGRNQAVG